MDDIRIVLIFFIGYIYGSIHPTSIIAKKIIGIDLNKKGSKKLGLGNFTTFMGKKWGFTLLPYELLIKGAIPVIIFQKYNFEISIIITTSIIIIIGHCWSIFNNFNGGRGILTGSGVLLIIAPKILFISLLLVIIGKYILRIRDSAILILFVLILLPVWSLIFQHQYEILLFSILFPLVTILKRVSSNSLIKINNNSSIKKVLIYRFIFDRDIRNRNKWKNQ